RSAPTHRLAAGRVGRLRRRLSLSRNEQTGNRKENRSVKYRTIVADPPWDRSDGTGFNFGAKANGGKHTPVAPHATFPPYNHLTLAEISALPIPDLAERDAHLYLWTTQRYLHESFHLIEGWGFRVSATLTWCKKPMGFMGGAFRSSTEFVHFA